MTGFKVNKMIPDEGLALGPSSDSRQGQTKEKTTMKQLMKSAALLASVGVAMLSVAGCNSVGDKPEDVVLAVLKNTQAGKTDQAFLNKYCEEDTAKLFTTFGSQMTEALKGATFTVAYSFVDDDVAVVVEAHGADAVQLEVTLRIQLGFKLVHLGLDASDGFGVADVVGFDV